MAGANIYKDIAERTQGDIYIGVVGPVRTGKSTLIKRFMETLVLPNIENESVRERARDEMPQSASGKTVMTTEPKFVPDEAVTVELADHSHFRIKMIDCVGYIVDGAAGLTEEEAPRMVMTPWSREPMEFAKAAEMGTQKVINEHSTIGLVVTTDGSIGEIPRASYEEAENRVIEELKAYNKPFVIILNSANTDSEEAIHLAFALEDKHKVPVALVNCLEINEKDIRHIIELVLFEFPINEIRVGIPSWVTKLEDQNELKVSLNEKLLESAKKTKKIADVKYCFNALNGEANIQSVEIVNTNLGKGETALQIHLEDGLFYKVLGDSIGFEITGEDALVTIMKDLTQIKSKYDKIADALRQVEEKGYGIVTPDIEDLTLEEPEIVKQSNGYGVKLKASADSVHMIRAKIQTEVSPIVGSERQSEDMVKYLLQEFEADPKKIWESNMFGKSLHELVNEGLNTKLAHMPDDARAKLGDTLQRIINEGSGGLICIIL